MDEILVLKFILLDKKQKTSTKTEILKQCIFPVLLYGCQTWFLTERKNSRLGYVSAEWKEKHCIYCREREDKKLRHTGTVRKRTGMTDIITIAMDQKWRWGGHMMRMDT